MGVAANLEDALEAAVRRFDGPSPVTPQVHHHRSAAAPAGRARMQLAIAVVEEEGGRAEDALDVAAAVEVLYDAILVHDMAEGGSWSAFGLAHGINAGDALSALAYLQLLGSSARRPPERTVEMTRALQQANFALCGAQAETGNVPADALFSAACELGALACGASAERAQAYARLGRTCAGALQMTGEVWKVEADALASAAGIDAGRRVRSLFAALQRA